MSRRVTIHSLGWLAVSCSIACMGTSFALAQREGDAPAEPPREERAADPQEPDAANRPRDERESESRDGRNASNRRGLPRDSNEPAGGPQEGDREPDRRDARQRTDQLGITFEGADDLVIGEVAPGSAAAQAGFRAQDRIISVNGRELTGQRRFAAFVGSLAGRRVPVIIERNGRRYTVQFTPQDVGGDGPWLGVYLQDNEEGQRGAMVTHIYPASPAARSGLRTGDVILSVNEEQIESTPDLISVLDKFQPKDKVKLQVQRGTQEMELTAILAQRDAYVFHASYDQEGDRRGGEMDDDDPWGNIPPQAMQLEHDRRMAEQHERIENELRKLQEEVRQLREAIEKK